MEMKREITRYMRSGAKVLLLGGMMLFVAGCVKRDMEIRPDEGYMEIALDWGGDSRPQEARYLLYSESGALIREVSGITDIFKGAFPVAAYRLVVHNTDARQVDWRGTEKYETAEVFAKATHYSEGHPLLEGVPCVLEPQVVFAAGRCEEGEKVEVRQLDTVRLTVRPRELTKQMKFRFIVNSTQPVQSLTGVLVGVAPGIFLADGSSDTSSPCAMEYTARRVDSGRAVHSVQGVETIYEARFNVFDLLADTQSPAGTNPLIIRLTLDDGSRSTGTFDLTPTLKELIAENGGQLPSEIPVEVAVLLRGVDLSATVAPWDDSGSGSGDPRPQAWEE